jgi:hypothetical protein
MIREPEVALKVAEAQIAWTLDHAGMSPWLKAALYAALDDDPVAVGNDVEVLRNLLQVRANAWVQDQLKTVEASGVPE